MGWYQKGKTNLDFTGARDSGWQWHQLGHMQFCTSLQTDNHASTPPLFFTGRMPFLPPNQQRQSTEGINAVTLAKTHYYNMVPSNTTLPRKLQPDRHRFNRFYRQGRLNQWAHWARAQGPRIFFLRGPQLAAVE